MQSAAIYLTSEDHARHPLNIHHADEGAPEVRTNENLGRAGGAHFSSRKVAEEAVVTCIACGVRLMEGEDYIIQESEAWQN